ncbi:MAG: peptidase [Gemmataceae bacterium]|jgi:tripeptide aminopeptidase|nr:MAG: peptidase [Gemmataceae bacterium]GIW84149.1 MAG: peptidase [Gemmataceae bacterium]
MPARKQNPVEIDAAAAVERLLRLLAVPGVTGQEEVVARTIADMLREVGVPSEAIRFDDAHQRIPEPTPVGNLIVQLPAHWPRRSRSKARGHADPILFATHMDTVPLCAGAEPKVEGRRIVNVHEGKTALGGDNRTGCAVLVTLAAELIRQGLPHPPLTLLFTVREESGLYGARYLNPADLGGVVMGFNVDGRNAAELTIGAIGADRWSVDIYGKAAHAGVAPEKGISATMILALAMQEVFRKGWWGKISQNGREGTSNIGYVGDAQGRSAGNATNVVTDYVHVKGESRSHDAQFVREITSAYQAAFQRAARKVKDCEGRTGRVVFQSRLDYLPFRLAEDAPVVQRAVRAAQAVGLEPVLRVTNGGLDANWLVKHGIPTVTFGAGQNEIHTVQEFVDLDEFDRACRLALALATLP